MFKWNHLPNPGGIYDQNPRLLEDFLVIREIEVKEENRQREAQQKKQKAPGAKAPRRRR